ncbi:AraC family transcriptional regulator [Brevibacterium picturae]|uniref:AraC family transcriptional regulator n=1 Tax=Brevibacterium picturae TaxID=260553 RepID=A0ABP4LTR7_9MICO
MALLWPAAGGPHARDAFILRMTMSGRWQVNIADRTPLTLLTVLNGSCIVQRADLSLAIERGEVAIISGTDPYTVRSAPRGSSEQTPASTAPALNRTDRFIVHPGQDCIGPDGQHVRQQLRRGVRAWGNSTDGQDQILVGTFTATSAVADLALEGTSLARVDDEETTNWARLLAREAEREQPAQTVVLDRLLDILTVQAMQKVSVPTSLGHRGISTAVAAMYDDPAKPWTVDSLARTAVMSRSAFSQTFHHALGTPPITYLTQIRLALAADALRDTDATLTQIARDVGYSSPFALSNAFSRQYGLNPKRMRAMSRPSRSHTA